MIGEKIKSLRKGLGLTQEQLAKKLRDEFGLKTDRATIGKWEIGYQVPEMYASACLSKLFGISLDTFNDESLSTLPSNIMPMPKMKKVPLLGTIACGEPILAAENIDSYTEVPDDIECDFSLRCKGDSMIGARIMNGDIVYVREQPSVENGEIAAVLIDNMETEATLKRVYISDNQIMLVPENRSYQPITFTGEDMNRVRILGKVIAFMSLAK